jgi:hypothetical protein
MTTHHGDSNEVTAAIRFAESSVKPLREGDIPVLTNPKTRAPT